MSVKPIVEYPNPVLKKVCLPVEDPHDYKNDLQDLIDTFYANTGVGLAAPQINLASRIIVVDTRRHIKYGKYSHGLLTLFNPVIITRSGRRTGREGCLSIPDFIVKVTRAEKIVLEALDSNGHKVILNIKGFEAICIQHEIDHLNGILMLDRVRSVRTDIFRRRME